MNPECRLVLALIERTPTCRVADTFDLTVMSGGRFHPVAAIEAVVGLLTYRFADLADESANRTRCVRTRRLAENWQELRMVPEVGIEPTHLSVPDFESAVSIVICNSA